MQKYKEIEKSIIKKYRKKIWSKFVKAVQEYQLVEENDKIMVCISGGKDSFLLAKCMEELKRHGKFYFDLEYVVMNPGYSEEHLNMIIENAKILNLPIKIFETNIFDVVETVEKSPCYLCARMRRGCLYKQAQELGCNKIALGHHFDDVIETTLLSIFYGAETKTMMPKLHSENFENMQLIRPMYLIKEEDIISWKDYNDMTFINCACRLTKQTLLKNDISKRNQIKDLIKKLRTLNSRIDDNIFKSMDNINLDCVLGYKKNNKKYNFLDEYNL